MPDVHNLVTSSSLTVYERDGSSLEMPLDALSVDGPNLISDASGLRMDIDHLPLLRHAERVRHGAQAVSMTEIAVGGFHRIFEITFNSAESLIARVSLPLSKNPFPRKPAWDQRKMEGEIAILRIIAQRAPRVPIPKILASDTRASREGNDVGTPWMLMEKVPGVLLPRVYNNFSITDKKALIADLAEILAAVFNIRASAAGSAIGLDDNMNPILGPVIGSSEPASSVFLGPGKLSTYDILDKRLAIRMENCSPAEQTTAHPVANSLQKILQLLRPQSLSNDYHLTHLDLSMTNIFVIAGPNGVPEVSGILDWEFHAFLPSQLAARSLGWLLYDGISDPLFNPVFKSTVWSWPERRENAQELHDVFLSVVNGYGNEMASAHKEGSLARQVFDWLDNWSNEAGYYSGICAWMQHVNDLLHAGTDTQVSD